jgi:hypothetical protein
VRLLTQLSSIFLLSLCLACVTSRAFITLPDGSVVEAKSQFVLGAEEKPEKVQTFRQPVKKIRPPDCYYDAQGNLYYERAGKYCPYKKADYRKDRL